MKHASTNYIIIFLIFAYSCNSVKIGMNSNDKSDIEKEWMVWRDSLKKQQPLLKKVIQDKVPINAMNDVYKQLYQIKDKNVRPYYVETKKELNKLTLYPMPVYEIDATKSPKWNDEQPLEPLLNLDKNKCYVYLGKGKTFYYGMALEKKDGVWNMSSFHIKAVNYADSISNLYFQKKEIPFWFIYTYKNHSKRSLTAYKNNGIWMYFGPNGKGLKLSTKVNQAFQFKLLWAESKYGNKIAEALTPFLPQAAVALKVTEGMTLLVGTVSEFLANNITKYDDGNGLSIKIYPQELRIEIVSN